MKWILFDAYGTLLNAGKENIPYLTKKMSEKYGVSDKLIFQHWSTGYFALEDMFGEKFMTIMQANRISLSYAFGVLGLPVVDVEDWMRKLIHLWSYPELYDGVKELFEDIGRLLPDVQIGVISNTDEDTITAAVAATQLPISFVMSSERAECYKPDPEIFRESLKELGIGADECIYIGNSVSDIVGAGRASISGIYIDRDHKPLPEGYSHIPVVADTWQLRQLLRERYA